MMLAKRSPRGFHLIEMLAVIGLTGLMLTLCVLTIQGLMSADKSTRSESAEAASMERLAASFRKDIHGARKAPEIASADRLAIDLGDGKSAEYHLKDGNIIVTRTRPGVENPSVETYRGKKWRASRVDREDLGGSSLVRLVFRPVGRAGEIDLPIEAAYGSGVTP